MANSKISVCVHIVFSTKNRHPWIVPPFDSKLHEYLGGVCKSFECNPIIVGGYTDHVHILCLLHKNVTLVNLLEKLKSHSSKWFKTLDNSLKNFYWQKGYAVLSADYRNPEPLKGYIQNQYNHHQKKTYKDEYLQLLKEYHIPFDERYDWD